MKVFIDKLKEKLTLEDDNADKTVVELENFSKINLKSNTSNVVIEKDDVEKPRLEYVEREKVSLDFSVSLGELTVVQKVKFHFSFGPNYYNSKLRVVVPRNFDLESVKLEVDAGNVKIRDLDLQEVFMDINAGNLKVEDTKVENFKLESNAGNVKLENVSSSDNKLELNAGNMKLKDSNLNRGKIEVNAGNIKIDNSLLDNVELDVNAGKVKYI